MFKHHTLLILAAGTVLLSLSGLSLLINANDLQQQQTLEHNTHQRLERSIEREEQRIRSLTVDLAWWDDTIRHTVLKYDSAWAIKNLGDYAHQNFQVDYSALITPDQQVLFQIRNGQLDSSIRLDMDTVSALIQQLPEHIDNTTPPSISGLVRLQGHTFILAAVPLTQEYEEFDPASYQHFILLMARQLDGPLLAQLQYDLTLKELTLYTSSEHTESHKEESNALSLTDYSGKPIGGLHMTLSRPDDSIHSVMLAAFAVLGASALLMIILTWRISRLLSEKQRNNRLLRAEVRRRKQAQQELYNLQEKLQLQIAERTLELEGERRRLHSIFDASADGIITIDGHGRMETINPAAAEMFGYQPEELIGEAVEILLRPSDRNGHEQYVEGSRLPQKRIINISRQLWALHKDGHEFPIDLNVAPIPGEKRGFVGVMRNISERVELEQTREQAISELRNVLETAAEGYVRVGNQGEILEVNEAFCQMLGRQRQHLLEQTLGDLVNAKSITTYNEQMGSRDVKLQRSYELALNTANGEGHFAVKATSVLSREGILDGSFAFVSDMTEIRHYQTILERTRDEAERANKAKSEFLSSMSHELRTPLNAILGFAQLLSNSRREPLSDRQQTQMKHILKGGQHLLTLINEVLDLARIEAGRVTLSLEPVEPADVVEECLTMLQGIADERQVRLLSPVADNTLPMIHADRTRFKQALLNLLSNAIKYNRPDGYVRLQVTTEHAHLRFSIEDNGVGIASHQQADLFKPFSRLSHETSDIEGTGIGLTITRQLIELMDGEIGFRSEAGCGSTFWFTLPRSEPGPVTLQPNTENIALLPSSDSENSEAEDNNPHQILYIEDNPANQQLMKQLLEELSSYELQICHSAELGLELAVQQPPALILMDINLPGISGLDAVQQLKASPLTVDIPVVAVSANAMPSTQRQAIEAGFSDYLTKPLELGQVMVILERYLSCSEDTPA
ncbi:MAG: PAS domain S-box protein [Marinobacterium sp.]|nr:PAS domain S-box protein [Marinobacterium sp.]